MVKTPYFPLVWEGILIKVEFLRTWVDPQLRKATLLPKMWQNILNKVSFDSTWPKPHWWKVICLLKTWKAFSQKAHLKQHELIHSDKKPHPCSFCDQKFSQKKCFKKHELIHTWENLHQDAQDVMKHSYKDKDSF